MKIVWEQSVYFGNAPVFCTICDRPTYPIRSGTNQLLIAVIYDKQGRVCGEACRDCVASGSEGIKGRVQDRIHRLQTKISQLETLAQDNIQTPSLEQEFLMHRKDGA